MKINIVRSTRRLRTVSARFVNDTLLVYAPAALSPRRLEKIVADFKIKFEKMQLAKTLNTAGDLAERAAWLNKKYFRNRLVVNSIEYVTRQTAKYACCDYRTGHIRISHRISSMPAWVRDYVIIHEMAHLLEPNHGRTFWDIISRYRLAERARGYLMAVREG